jgi:hypothetical protein
MDVDRPRFEAPDDERTGLDAVSSLLGG